MTEEVAEKKPRATAAKKTETMTIYERINAISMEAGALAPESKGGVPFAFRGIDGTVAHLTPFLHKYGVFLSPVVQSHIVIANANGNRTVKTTELEVRYIVYGPDGKSDIEIVVPGLADDFADRSSAQAMSVAYRIALLQLFHLPTHTKEPEETGQLVYEQSGQAAAPAGPKAVNAARKASGTAAPTQASSEAALTRLQAEAKRLGIALDKGPDDLNTLGQKHADGDDNWFSNAGVLKLLVDELQAEVDGKGK